MYTVFVLNNTVLMVPVPAIYLTSASGPIRQLYSVCPFNVLEMYENKVDFRETTMGKV